LPYTLVKRHGTDVAPTGRLFGEVYPLLTGPRAVDLNLRGFVFLVDNLFEFLVPSDMTLNELLLAMTTESNNDVAKFSDEVHCLAFQYSL
jgi:hypothetical protein